MSVSQMLIVIGGVLLIGGIVWQHSSMLLSSQRRDWKTINASDIHKQMDQGIANGWQPKKADTE